MNQNTTTSAIRPPAPPPRNTVTPAQQLAAGLGDTIIRLNDDFIGLYESMPGLGQVAVSTGNGAVAITRTGTYGKMSHEEAIGLTIGRSIDLRIFYDKWGSVFACHSPSGERSLHVFDIHGQPVTRVILEPDGNREAFDRLIGQHGSARQETALDIQPVPAGPAEADGVVDISEFHAAWDAMTDPHQFFGMLKRFGLSRHRAMEIARQDQACRLQDDALGELLRDVMDTATPIMVFVGNCGQIQIHTGALASLGIHAGIMQINATDLDLILNTREIASQWVVRKPTTDGTVTSVELYDAQGRNVAMLFGARKPGHPEREDWRAAVARRR